MPTGTVTFFNEAKGLGIITPDGGEAAVPFLVAGLKEDIKVDDMVGYDVVDGKKGPTAVNIVVIG